MHIERSNIAWKFVTFRRERIILPAKIGLMHAKFQRYFNIKVSWTADFIEVFQTDVPVRQYMFNSATQTPGKICAQISLQTGRAKFTSGRKRASNPLAQITITWIWTWTIRCWNLVSASSILNHLISIV